MAARESWREEMQSAYLYRALAESESGNARGQLFAQLAKEAERQAGLWEARLREQGSAAPHGFAPGARARFAAWLVGRIGGRAMRPALAALKVRGLSLYSLPSLGTAHAVPTSLAQVERRHRGMSHGGSLRAAVFGVNDGLVSNASLILGVAGAEVEPRFVLLSGLAGLLAGAFSMAAGEFVSVKSQRELFEYQIGLERAELEEYPEEEEAEVALIYEARGMSREEARALAARVMSDKEHALDTLAREELGLNPDDLGSPWQAALASFTAFAGGALVPLAPFLIGSGPRAVVATAIVSAVALFGVGCALSLFTGRDALHSGLRMLAIGGAAGLATWLVGRLLGVQLT